MEKRTAEKQDHTVTVEAIEPLKDKDGKTIPVGGTTELPYKNAKILETKKVAKILKEGK